jgi:hypothetical protein
MPNEGTGNIFGQRALNSSHYYESLSQHTIFTAGKTSKSDGIYLWSTIKIQNALNILGKFVLQFNTCSLRRLRNTYFSLWRHSLNLGLGLPPWNSPFHFGLLDPRHSVGLLGRVISSSRGLYLYAYAQKRTHAHAQTPNIHALSGIRTYDPTFRASEDSACLTSLGYRDRPSKYSETSIHRFRGGSWKKTMVAGKR